MPELNPGAAGVRARTARSLPVLRALRGLGLASLLLVAPSWAEMAVPVEDTPGVVMLPDHWRPIPRAEIVEAHDRALQANGGAGPPLPAAAFQQLPTLRWFTLPLAQVYWQPHGGPEVLLPAGDGDAPEHPAPDLSISHAAGQGRGAQVWRWICIVERPEGRFRLELLTTADDGRALILAMAQGLRAPAP